MAAPPVSAVASTATTVSPAVVSARPGPDASTGWCRVVRGPIELPIRAPALFVVAAIASTPSWTTTDGRGSCPFAAGPFPTSTPVRPPPAREPAEAGPGGVAAPVRDRGRLRLLSRPRGRRSPGRAWRATAIASSPAAGTVRASPRPSRRRARGARVSREPQDQRGLGERGVARGRRRAARCASPKTAADATAVDLAVRGASLLALSIDARTALTAMHVRVRRLRRRRPARRRRGRLRRRPRRSTAPPGTLAVPAAGPAGRSCPSPGTSPTSGSRSSGSTSRRVSTNRSSGRCTRTGSTRRPSPATATPAGPGSRACGPERPSLARRHARARRGGADGAFVAREPCSDGGHTGRVEPRARPPRRPLARLDRRVRELGRAPGLSLSPRGIARSAKDEQGFAL